MRFGLAIFAFDRRWLNEDRMRSIEAAFEIAPPTKAQGA